MGVAVDGLCPPSAGLQRNQWCTFSRPAAAAFFPYKAQGKRSTSVLTTHPCFCAVLQQGGFVEHPQQGHLFFFRQLGIVDADLSHQDIHAHPEFPRIVFHGLQHSSATYQLMISGGDIKAVQGTTGHASADMLVNTYAHIQQSSRVELGKKFESGFYAKPDTSSPQAVPAAGEPTISMTALLELLKDADPEMKAKLRLALLT